MDPIQGYVAQAQSTADFIARHPHPFLLKRSRDRGRESEDPGAKQRLAFQTEQLQIDAQGLFMDEGAFAHGYWVWPVKKRAGNPFPDRIVLGRATNCDVVVRLSYVSKTHAHLEKTETGWQIADAGSSNGTELDGVPLTPRHPYELSLGQKLRFGALELAFLDAASLAHVIRTEIA